MHKKAINADSHSLALWRIGFPLLLLRLFDDMVVSALKQASG